MDPERVVRTLVDAWNRGDVDGFVACLDPGIEFRASGVYPGLSDTYRGHVGMRRFWNDFKDAWEELTIELEDLRVTDERVIALYRFRGRAREGPPVGRVGANVFRVEDGLVVFVTAHGTWEEALDAALYP